MSPGVVRRFPVTGAVSTIGASPVEGASMRAGRALWTRKQLSDLMCYQPLTSSVPLNLASSE